MIDILMATYNAGLFLRPQLDSILKQTNEDWRLFVRDDYSSDITIQILEEYQKQYPEKIHIVSSDAPSGSAQNNFFELIQYWQMHGSANYVMFADQDDIWLPEKIQCSFNKMKQMEKENGKEFPLLVHTDLKVVDKTLHVLNDSLFDMHNMDAKRNQLNNILVQNIVTGCTVMVNRPLLTMVHTIPQNVVMHDMWLALIAAAFGKIGFVNQATMLYRQHGKNVKGARNMKSLSYFFSKLSKLREVHEGLVEQYRQAGEFLKLYNALLNTEQKEMLAAYSTFEEKSIVQKFQALNSYQLYKKGFVRKLGQILL